LHGEGEKWRNSKIHYFGIFVALDGVLGCYFRREAAAVGQHALKMRIFLDWPGVV
jgi:hypothetical protein